MKQRKTTTDTIPRLQRLAYLTSSIEGVRRDSTFDEIRESILEVAQRSSTSPSRAGGYRAEYRARDSYSGWTNAREALDEAIRLEIVKPAALPRKRVLVDGHRGDRYHLTDSGAKLLGDAISPAHLREAVFSLMYRRHPYLRQVLSVLNRQSLLIPEFNLKQISDINNTMFTRVAAEAIRRLQAADLEPPKANDLEARLKQYFRQRQQDLGLINKIQLVDLINYGLLGIMLPHYGLEMDHVSFDTIVGWGESEFFFCNSSRYVPNIQGWAVYSTASIDAGNDGPVRLLRHRRAEYEEAIVGAIHAQFRSLRGQNPFVPIYRIQAAVCHGLGINDALFDAVLRDIYGGKTAAPFALQLDGARPSELPSPIAPTEVGGGRYYVMTLFEGKEG